MKKFKKKKKNKKRDSNGKIILPNNLAKKEAYPEDLKSKIKIMFLQGKSYGEIIRNLAEIYTQVPNKSTISKWRNKEDWDAERDKFHRKVEQRAIQEISDTAAQTKGRAYNLLDELENRVRAKLYMIDDETGKAVPRYDIPTKELKALVDMAHKIVGDRVLLNPDPKDKDSSLVVKSLQEIQEIYLKTINAKAFKKKKKRKQIEMENDPETGFVPPSDIVAENKKVGMESLS